MKTGPAPAGYEAARSVAAVFPISDGGRFRLIGPDARDFLHRMVTNDVLGLSPGRGAYATLLDISGRMIADLTIWLLDEETILIETAAAARDNLIAALDRYIIMERVEIENAPDLARLTVLGPRSREALEKALDTPIPALQPGEVRAIGPDASGLLVCRPVHAFPGGLDVYAPSDRLEEVRAALRASGVAEGTPEALEVLRIESGAPKWGAELSETVIPLEAGLEGSGVSFTKGCYPGQEIIARIHARGAPARRLGGIRFEGAPPPAETEVTIDGRAAGAITSAALSPTHGGIALAYFKKDTGAEGDPVTAGGVHGTVAALPFAEPEE